MVITASPLQHLYITSHNLKLPTQSIHPPPPPPPTMSDSSSYSSSNSDDLDPSKVLDKYISEQNVLDSFASRIIEKMKGRFGAGRSKRQGGTRKTIHRDHVDAHSHLVADYFAEHPLYPERMFRTRFCMHKPLFLRIVEALGQWSPYLLKGKIALAAQVSLHFKSAQQHFVC